jgi:hypothetical protein
MHIILATNFTAEIYKLILMLDLTSHYKIWQYLLIAHFKSIEVTTERKFIDDICIL